MKILIIGANGQIGSKIVHKLNKNSNHDPVAMVRKEEQKSQFSDKGIDTVLGDLEDDFEHAVKGCDAVIFTAGSGANTGKDKTHLVDRVGAKKAIDFATKNGVDRFMMISAFGADFSPSEWPDSMKHYYEAKADADKALMQSNLNYTILKPGRLTNEEAKHKIDLAEKTEQRGGSITREDVADVAIKIIDHKPAFKMSYELLNGDTTIDHYFN